ncbi:MAG TPA: hypothetical protein VHX88_17720 [Solirubrobacteraceae bacterium]|nr:hypothetical protein [Solirubrobacteraceae bacterium]
MRLCRSPGGVTTTALTTEHNAGERFDRDTVVLRFGPSSDRQGSGASIAAGPPGAYRPTLRPR